MTTSMRQEKVPNFQWSGLLPRPSTTTYSRSNLMSGHLVFCCTRSWHLAKCLTQVRPKINQSHPSYSKLYQFFGRMVRSDNFSLFFSRHDKLPCCPTSSSRLPNVPSPQVSQNHVWHHDGLLEWEWTGPTHIWDLAVEVGGILWPEHYLLWWNCALLAHWPKNSIIHLHKNNNNKNHFNPYMHRNVFWNSPVKFRTWLTFGCNTVTPREDAVAVILLVFSLPAEWGHGLLWAK